MSEGWHTARGRHTVETGMESAPRLVEQEEDAAALAGGAGAGPSHHHEQEEVSDTPAPLLSSSGGGASSGETGLPPSRADIRSIHDVAFARVVGHRTAPVDGRPVVWYTVAVKVRQWRWAAEKRFSEFAAFADKVAGLGLPHYAEHVAAFPSRYNWADGARRQCALDAYTRSLLAWLQLLAAQDVLQQTGPTMLPEQAEQEASAGLSSSLQPQSQSSSLAIAASLVIAFLCASSTSYAPLLPADIDASVAIAARSSAHAPPPTDPSRDDPTGSNSRARGNSMVVEPGGGGGGSGLSFAALLRGRRASAAPGPSEPPLATAHGGDGAFTAAIMVPGVTPASLDIVPGPRAVTVSGLWPSLEALLADRQAEGQAPAPAAPMSTNGSFASPATEHAADFFAAMSCERAERCTLPAGRFEVTIDVPDRLEASAFALTMLHGCLFLRWSTAAQQKKVNS